MKLLQTAAAMTLAGLIAACTAGAELPSDISPVDPMTDSGLAADPMNPGSIDDSVGTQM